MFWKNYSSRKQQQQLQPLNWWFFAFLNYGPPNQTIEPLAYSKVFIKEVI